MSACDICPRPGRCCTGLELSGGNFPKGDTALEALVELASVWGKAPDKGIDKWELGLPFIPLQKIESATGSVWRLWCPNLDIKGRCSDYFNRPFACRHYTPLEDVLCAAFSNNITKEAFTPRLEYHAP